MSPKSDIDRTVRGYSWPPFAPGHELSTRHGAWSERKYSPLAAELLDDVLAQAEHDPDLAHLRSAAFRPALRSWARTEARIELLATYLDERTTDDTPGDLDADGEVRPAADLMARLENSALKQRAALALDPASMARLRRDAGAARNHFDLANLMAGLDTDDGDDDAEARP